MGCTEAEWLGWLPRAIGEHPFELGLCRVKVDIGGGSLIVRWQVASPRVIALARIPRLLVTFEFDCLSDQQRLNFMKRFDLYTQRGGG